MPHKTDRPRLSVLENAVMQIVWERQRLTSDEVRAALRRVQDLKDSTVRTVLRRLEEKGYVEHDVDGRTYVYRPRVEPQSVATQQVRSIVERFCRGSVENLLVGMVDDDLISPEKLRELAERISQADAAQKKSGRVKKETI
jgi:BlaI family transcriptional regulator, penicillinase repressor